MARRGTRFPAASLRERLAQEAARLIIEHGIADYGQAKRKAAERLGVSEAGALPSNAHIEASLAERQRIFEADTHHGRLSVLRSVAARMMDLFSLFRPRLVGPVLTGTATSNSAIELHLFADYPESVVAVLEQSGLAFRDCQRRFRFTGRTVLVPGFSFRAEGEEVYAMTFPENGLREAPLSPVDRRPMRRAGKAEVLALLNGAPAGG